jgi:hypothetical protein
MTTCRQQTDEQQRRSVGDRLRLRVPWCWKEYEDGDVEHIKLVTGGTDGYPRRVYPLSNLGSPSE